MISRKQTFQRMSSLVAGFSLFMLTSCGEGFDLQNFEVRSIRFNNESQETVERTAKFDRNDEYQGRREREEFRNGDVIERIVDRDGKSVEPSDTGEGLEEPRDRILDQVQVVVDPSLGYEPVYAVAVPQYSTDLGAIAVPQYGVAQRVAHLENSLQVELSSKSFGLEEFTPTVSASPSDLVVKLVLAFNNSSEYIDFDKAQKHVHIIDYVSCYASKHAVGTFDYQYLGSFNASAEEIESFGEKFEKSNNSGKRTLFEKAIEESITPSAASSPTKAGSTVLDVQCSVSTSTGQYIPIARIVEYDT